MAPIPGSGGDNCDAAGPILGRHRGRGRQALDAALRSLSRRTRAVIVLRYVADLPEAEVAAALGCSIGTLSRIVRS
ncbi:sigma-70 family RNA polymerase sigma factor [Micromonospora sp. NPDC047707]|uniref:RNA polymerase sigma factor n=1 Tax=Micromonospora sp. NPDC047707 TaxID=3154498 RepID=UPI003454297C